MNGESFCKVLVQLNKRWRISSNFKIGSFLTLLGYCYCLFSKFPHYNDVMNFLQIFHIWANPLFVNPCTKFCCDRATSNEDNEEGMDPPPPKPKIVKKSPVRLGLKTTGLWASFSSWSLWNLPKSVGPYIHITLFRVDLPIKGKPV